MKKILFAPLQGYTEANYRNAHAAVFGNIDTYYTPFVRLEKGQIRSKDIRGVEPANNTVPHLVPQLIGNNADKAERVLTLFTDKGYKEVDINMGCPFPLLAKRHNGSGILPYPEEVKQLLSIIQKHPEINFSVKMRLGWEQADECIKLIPMLNEMRLTHITMHPRLGKQQYKGDVDMQGFKAFANICQHPIIYNGDIRNVDDIKDIESNYPFVSGIMVGRGLLMNPALGIEYKEGRILSADEMKEKLRKMHEMIFSRYEEQLQGGEMQLLNKVKTFWEYLEPQIGHKAWKAIHKSTNLNKYTTAVNSI